MHPFLTGLSATLPRAGFWEAPAIVAVSGGADSVALLVGLLRLAPPGSRLVVAHACHDLRSDAHEDRRFVADLAARLGVPCESRSIAVRDDQEGRGEGIEARARRLRYGFFVDVAYEHAARHVVVGHTADDQAETILHRALRGTGLAGLAGMRPSRALADGIALLRPMLALPRSMGRAFLEAEGEAWQEDATNADPRYARNFLRHEILPRVARGPYPGASDALVRLGHQAACTAAALDSAATVLLETHVRRHADGRIILDAASLAHLDGHLLGQMLVVLWEREGWPRRHMTARHYEAIVRLIVAVGRGDEPSQSSFDLPAGLRARMAFGRQVEVAPQTPVASPAQ
ncbi:MAG: tRNA lysidine(34) synthetase TilS [Planctomycetia bacterium]